MSKTFWWIYELAEAFDDDGYLSQLMKTHKGTVHNIKQKMALKPRVSQRMYFYEPNQYVLPYSEHRRVSNSDWGYLDAAKFPCWDRTPDDKLCVVRVPMPAPELRTWAIDQCEGRFHVKSFSKEWSIVTFEKYEDAVKIKLTF